MHNDKQIDPTLQTEKTPVKCSCRWKNCKRHGDCAACRAHHAQHAKHPLPACEKKRTDGTVHSGGEPQNIFSQSDYAQKTLKSLQIVLWGEDKIISY